MQDNRKIIHIDMDAFFASVEQRDFPELRGKPVLVGGMPGKRGVVAAASYEARRYGIRSAMPSTQAYQRCPHAIFVRARFDVYRSVSQQIRAIFRQYTDLVEPLSLDEAFLDVTHNRKSNPSATLIAQDIRQLIFQETGLTASAGVAPNKFLAKVASDINKPNGIFVIPPKDVLTFIEQLPIGRFFGIGKATEKKMQQLHIQNGADLRDMPESDLIRHFGKAGAYYYRISRGQDNRPVSPHRVRKSVGVEETFDKNLSTRDEMDRVLIDLAQTLEGRLRKAELSGKTVTLKLRYANFETITRGRTLDRFLSEAEPVLHIVQGLMSQIDLKGKEIRLLGLTMSNLDNQPELTDATQLLLPFGDEWGQV